MSYDGNWGENLADRRYGRLLVVERTDQGKGDGRRVWMWKCLCVCGTIKHVGANNLRSGDIKSCGCLKREMTSARRLKHGMSSGGPTPRPEYEVWKGMLARCNNPHHKSFRNYGGRGITVYPEWAKNFSAFLAHIGPRPDASLTVERIDNDRGYEPGNVCWATRKQQRANQRRPAAAST